MSLDEYTSKRNRRYVNINVHGHDERIWCLGMVRGRGSLHAEETVNLVNKKLLDFGINFTQHILACVTDGASGPLHLSEGSLVRICHACTPLPQRPSAAISYYNPRFAMRVHNPVPASGVLNETIVKHDRFYEQ